MISLELVTKLLLYSIHGIVWALIVSLVALGLSFIFGLMEIVNVAHGELYMLGAVLIWYGLSWFGNFWLAAIVATLVGAILGIGLERGILRAFEGKPHAHTMIITIGLSFILQQIALATVGGNIKAIVDPLPGVKFLGVTYPSYRLLVAGISTLVLVGLWLFLHMTPIGLWIRAAMQDKDMASAMGVSVGRVYTASFSIGTMLAVLGGALAAPIVQVFYLMGGDLLLVSFIIVIVGGLGSLKGTLVASLIICPLESIMVVLITPTEAKVVSFMIMAAVLLVRPGGLFGTAQR